jgi:hypothetical protein
MPATKSADDERQIILSSPQKRPYGALLRVHVQTAGAFGQVEQAEIPLPTGAFVTLAPASIAPWEGGRKYVLRLEGYPTAAAAESAARRLVQAVLWTAISSDAPLRLDYKSYDPFSIFERNRSEGLNAQAYGESYFQPEKVFDEIKHGFARFDEPDQRLVLSMEIFAGARLEASDRARFLTVVSALEPLADPKPLGEAAESFVSVCVAELKRVAGLPAEIRASLDGRVRQLRTESIRQSIQRAIAEMLPDDPVARDTIDRAYAVRSQIVHSGRPQDLDVDLDAETSAVSRVVRALYSERFRRQLMRPSAA